MELIKLDLNNICLPDNLVACIGVFDGVHSGHNKVINKVINVASEKKLKSALITFDPHPDFVLKKIDKEQYITPLNDRIKLLGNNFNLDYLIIINFTKELAALSFESFYNLFLKSLNTIVVGEGFRFGYKNLGEVKDLKKLHPNDVISVPHEFYSNINHKISSQDILVMLEGGKISDVMELGVTYKVSGVVIKGSQIGNRIGYPTANIDVQGKYCLVKNGVYAVIIIIDNQRYLAIANYGYNPSFNMVEKPRLEVHIFDFNSDIYGKKVEVEFIDFIREEIKFPSVDEFLKQLKEDCNLCISKFGGKYETINCRSNG
jgi:riboflavin kinase/FMN adenylyltransferase